MSTDELAARIKGRMEDCQIVLVGDRWKENYKEDVSALLSHIGNVEGNMVYLQQVIALHVQVMNFLGSALREVADYPDSPRKDLPRLMKSVKDLSKSTLEKAESILRGEQQNGNTENTVQDS